MSKEKFLTVLVPIKDGDCETTVYANLSALQSAIPASEANKDKIYKVTDGTYYRSLKDSATGLYAYNAVTEREFPYLGDPLEIFDFAYDATRMGNAPTISAQGIMRFADKDVGGNDVTLEGLWTQECHVKFNGENFYIKNIPTSSKSNEDARYRYDLDFVSETVCLEQVYFYDVVAPFVTGKPVSENSTFSFYGDIKALSDRINSNFIMSGLASLVRKHVNYENHPTIEVPYLIYSQWNQVNVYPFSLVPSVFETSWHATLFLTEIYNPLNGDYNSYLMQYIYVNNDGVYASLGYKCKIGKDKKGATATSEEKMVSFDKNTIYEALQQFHDTFESDYYVTKEKDVNGDFTGNTLVVVGDCEHDFADWDDENEDYVRDDEGLPMTDHPFDYGAINELLSKEKTNTTEKIVTRITGIGGEENIPWYYPNPNPDGWIKPIFKTKDEIQSSITIDYPTDEGTTAEDYVRYEKYLKNRIGKTIRYGAERDFKVGTNYSKIQNLIVLGVYNYGFYVEYPIINRGYQNPRLTFSMLFPSESLCEKFEASLIRTSTGDIAEHYSSSQTYPNPTQFQTMCIDRDGWDATNITTNVAYTFKLAFYFDEKPLSRRYDYEGYHYPSASIPLEGGSLSRYAHIGEDFYQYPNLQPFVEYTWVGGENYIITDYGYSTDGLVGGKVLPIPRIRGGQYKDVASGTIYRCNTSDITDVMTGMPSNPFDSNPTMSWDEWISTFLNMRLRLYEAYNWYIGNNQIQLSDYGLGTPMLNGSEYVPDIFDTIDFRRVKYLTPQTNLMPEVYVKTDGERRFYNAHNYWDEENETLYEGTADTAVGEVQDGNYVKNPIYKENETDSDAKHYHFENEYIRQLPHEHIEDFDDIKPTIKEQTNTVDGNVLRIDVVESFDYDWTDNDEIWESSDGGGTQGEYKHPYFFAKLRPLGFNIFDLALQDDMVLSMTTGACGACSFKIGVDENSKKNPVQIWEYDVYDGEDLSNATKLYSAGELRRYINTVGLYYDNNGTAVPINTYIGNKGGGETVTTNYGTMYTSYKYSVDEVAEGYVGTTKKGGSSQSNHFEGDVVTSGRYIDSQQDTSCNYVWVALMKETDTYGTLMPSAVPNYNYSSYDLYIRPKSISDVHTPSSTSSQDEEKADKFVLLNIKMPQIYLRRAERKLSQKLVKYMYENNAQKFNFSIKFSRIYLAENASTDDNLDENSVVYVLFNGRTYRQYVKHYTYRMSHDASLPEITIDANDELPVTMTLSQRQERTAKNTKRWVSDGFTEMGQKIRDNVGYSTEYSTTINVQKIEWGEF